MILFIHGCCKAVYSSHLIIFIKKLNLNNCIYTKYIQTILKLFYCIYTELIYYSRGDFIAREENRIRALIERAKKSETCKQQKNSERSSKPMFRIFQVLDCVTAFLFLCCELSSYYSNLVCCYVHFLHKSVMNTNVCRCYDRDR